MPCFIAGDSERVVVARAQFPDGASDVKSAEKSLLFSKVLGIIIVDLPAGFNHEQKKSNANPGYHCEHDKKYFHKCLHDVAPQVPSKRDDLRHHRLHRCDVTEQTQIGAASPWQRRAVTSGAK